MNSRRVEGKRIHKVYQQKVWDPNRRRWVWDLRGLLLEDGTYVSFSTAELEGDYATVTRLSKVERTTI